MDEVTDLLDRIQQRLPGLRPSEQSIARFVLSDPERALRMSITNLADHVEVSVATVARFCSGVDASGYGDFRRQLTAALTRNTAELSRFGVSDTDVSPTDDIGEVITKIALHEVHAIQATANSLDVTAIDAVVDAVIAAPRIDIYGSAASAVAGVDLQQKLHRLALASFHWSDPHLALASAAILQEGCVAIGISHSGLTIETAHAIAVARDAGATTVAITNYPDSPLARAADHVLCTVARETRYRSGAMSGRMAQLAIVDFLFVRAAQRRHDQVPGSLEERYHLIQAHRLNYHDDVSSPSRS
ncbi:MAG: MurR/RpiR family transcriptional regulator [Microbacterium sp.]